MSEGGRGGREDIVFKIVFCFVLLNFVVVCFVVFESERSFVFVITLPGEAKRFALQGMIQEKKEFMTTGNLGILAIPRGLDLLHAGIVCPPRTSRM